MPVSGSTRPGGPSRALPAGFFKVPGAVLLLLVILQPLQAQFLEYFKDSSLTVNPPWAGDLTSFNAGGNGWLQLNAAPQTGEVQLYTSSRALLSASWKLSVFLGFNPSSSNQLWIYLATASEQLTSSNALYMRIGGVNDNISLYQRHNNKEYLLGESATKSLDADSVAITIELLSDSVGNFILHTTFLQNGIRETDSLGRLVAQMSPVCFALLFNYTATRSDKFWLGSIEVTGKAESTPPRIVSIAARGTTAEVKFDEPVGLGCATLHAALEPEGLLPDSIVLNSETSVLFYFSAIVSGKSYNLRLSGICDFAGNVMAPAFIPVTFRLLKPPTKGSLQFSEIMAHPPPGTPEFVEITNMGPDTLELDSLYLNGVLLTGQAELAPDHSALIISDKEEGLWPDIPTLHGSFGGIPFLTNTGKLLELSNGTTLRLSTVEYSDSWYRDPGKSDGGYSLELIGGMKNCINHESAWTSSAVPGGTPGYAAWPLPGSLEEEPLLYFRDDLLSIAFSYTVKDSGNWTIEPPAVAIPLPQSAENRICLQFSPEPGISYRISNLSVTTCDDHLPVPVSFNFEFPLSPETVQLNELLFNPALSKAGFFELSNPGEHFLSLEKVSVSSQEPPYTQYSLIDTSGLILKPGSQLAFSAAPWQTRAEYPGRCGTVMQPVEFPSFSSVSGQLSLFSPGYRQLEFLTYDDQMHSSYLASREGVSLERISEELPASDRSNWTSAASVNGFGTPGLPNSQRQETPEGNELELSTQVISPDNDGQEDHVLISIQTPGNAILSLQVFDRNGHLVKNLALHELAGTTVKFVWKGDDNAGIYCSRGTYIIAAEVLRGEQKRVLKKIIRVT